MNALSKVTAEGARHLVTGQILISDTFRQSLEKAPETPFLEQVFVVFFPWELCMIVLLCKVRAVQTIWLTNGHVFALLLNILLRMSISVSSECIWDNKLSGSCLRISLSFGPTGQFSGLIVKLPISLCSFCLLSTGYYGNIEWGDDSIEMSVVG